VIRRGRAADTKAELASARAEIARLTDELRRLKMERLRGNPVAAAIERADDVAAEGEDGDDERWLQRVDALVLRETLLDLCGSMERAMAAVRAQLTSGLRPNELDRRRGGDRRRADRPGPASAATVDGRDVVVVRPRSTGDGDGDVSGPLGAGSDGSNGNGGWSRARKAAGVTHRRLTATKGDEAG
jgi:hypothetical protein